MKKIFIISACVMLFLTGGCGAADRELDSSQAAEIIEIKTPDIGEGAGIEDIIIPFYLPRKLSDGRDVRHPSVSKSGDKAAISAGGTVLVELYYTQDVQSFPEPGKAELTAQGGNYTLKMRLNSKTACTLKSAGIPRDELIRIAESFYLETGPVPVTAAPSAGQSLEGNITAYEELTPAVRVVLEHIAKEPGSPYGIVAYQQAEFEGGTLVLAEGLRDGENHPELYYVDRENVIRNWTAGSDCWELNFTEFRGKRVYYGRTYSEVPVTEAAFRYDGASVSAAPHAKGVIAVKNETEETESFIKNRQGYIAVTDRKDIPISFEIKKDGKTVNYTEEMLLSTPVPPYQDVEDPSIRCASLYQYNHMAALGGGGAPVNIGWVFLQSGENERQLEFAGCFENVSLQELFTSLSGYALYSNYLNESQLLPAGGKAKLISEKGLPKDANIKCYFSELTPGMWSSFKTTGTISFLRTLEEPYAQGNIQLPDNAGYYLIAICADGPDAEAGTLVYTGVIGLD